MSKIKAYDFINYSIFNIQDYLKELGYEYEKRYYRQIDRVFVKGHDISIDFPNIDIQGPDAYIRFEDYPKAENYEKSKKLYQQLSRKFGRKKDERWDQKAIHKIKDLEKMEIIDWRQGGKKIKGEKLLKQARSKGMLKFWK